MPTPNHDYNQPEKGEVDWHIPLNENFDRLDSDIEIRDVSSAMPDYKPRDGAKFLAVDTGEVWLGDGNTWIGNGDPWGQIPTPEQLDGTVSKSNQRLLSEGMIVATGMDIFNVMDPADSQTPVDDLMLEFHNQGIGGEIRLPPGPIEHNGEILAVPGVDIIGTGGNGYNAYDTSRIEFTHGGRGLVLGERVRRTSYSKYEGFMIGGKTIDEGGQGSPAILLGGDPQQNILNHLTIRKWNGPAIQTEEDLSASAFEQYFGLIFISFVDAGNSNALIDWFAGGAPNQWGTVGAYPSSAVSGKESVVLSGPGRHNIAVLNIGGNAREAIITRDTISLGTLNWEPEQLTVPEAVIKLSSHAPASMIGQIESFAGEADHFYQLTNGRTPGVDNDNPMREGLGNKKLDIPLMRDVFGGGLNGVPVDVQDAPDGPIIYTGTEEDIGGPGVNSNVVPLGSVWSRILDLESAVFST